MSNNEDETRLIKTVQSHLSKEQYNPQKAREAIDKYLAQQDDSEIQSLLSNDTNSTRSSQQFFKSPKPAVSPEDKKQSGKWCCTIL